MRGISVGSEVYASLSGQTMELMRQAVADNERTWREMMGSATINTGALEAALQVPSLSEQTMELMRQAVADNEQWMQPAVLGAIDKLQKLATEHSDLYESAMLRLDKKLALYQPESWDETINLAISDPALNQIAQHLTDTPADQSDSAADPAPTSTGGATWSAASKSQRKNIVIAATQAVGSTTIASLDIINARLFFLQLIFATGLFLYTISAIEDEMQGQ